MDSSPRPSPTLRLLTRASAVLALVFLVTACSGRSNSESLGRTVTTNASVEPKPFCQSISQRRALGRRPPAIGFQLRGSDVDNFTGESAFQCNLRQLIYWSPETPFSGGWRLAATVTLFFTGGVREARLAAIPDRRVDRIERLADGTRVMVFEKPGESIARVVVRSAVVDVQLACLDPRTQKVSACKPPHSGRRQASLRQIVSLLVPDLRRVLSRGG